MEDDTGHNYDNTEADHVNYDLNYDNGMRVTKIKQVKEDDCVKMEEGNAEGGDAEDNIKIEVHEGSDGEIEAIDNNVDYTTIHQSSSEYTYNKKRNKAASFKDIKADYDFYRAIFEEDLFLYLMFGMVILIFIVFKSR